MFDCEQALTFTDIRCDIRADGYKGKPETLHTLDLNADKAPLSQTAAILDFFPFLRRMPEFLLSTKREGRAIHRREIKLFRDHYVTTRQKLKDGTAKASMLTSKDQSCVDADRPNTAERLCRPGQDAKGRRVLG